MDYTVRLQPLNSVGKKNSLQFKANRVINRICAQAGVAQLVEQLTCNQQVAGSIPVASSIKNGHW